MMLKRDLRASDDNIYMYYNGITVLHYARAMERHRQLISNLRSVGASSFAINRAIIKSNYMWGFLIPSTTIAIARLLCCDSGSPHAYNSTVANSILFGYIAT